jgi:hypothetical protein
VDIALMGGAGIKAVAAGAHNAEFVVSGMDGCFHDVVNLNSESFDSKGYRKDSATGDWRG